MGPIKNQPPRRRSGDSSSGGSSDAEYEQQVDQPRPGAQVDQPRIAAQGQWEQGSRSDTFAQEQSGDRPRSATYEREVATARPGATSAKQSSSRAIAIGVVAVVVLFAVVAGIWVVNSKNSQESSAQSASSKPETTASKIYTTVTSTSSFTPSPTVTRETTRETETYEPTSESNYESDYDSSDSSSDSGEQFPAVPYDPPSHYSWVTNGPFGTGTSTNCIQIAVSEYNKGGSDDYTDCFRMSDGWYYYSLRGAG